jgi:hypothetical protein
MKCVSLTESTGWPRFNMEATVRSNHSKFYEPLGNFISHNLQHASWWGKDLCLTDIVFSNALMMRRWKGKLIEYISQLRDSRK